MVPFRFPPLSGGNSVPRRRVPTAAVSIHYNGFPLFLQGEIPLHAIRLQLPGGPEKYGFTFAQ
jgi:hypothetical protein